MSLPTRHYTFVACLEDRPGVLNRVVSLFRRRAFNIVSLNVGHTHEPGLSRMTVVVEADANRARLLAANLHKLVEVRSVDDVTDTPAVVRDMALLKVQAPLAKRGELFKICDVFHARIVDMTDGSLVLEATGTPTDIDRLVVALRPYGITEMVLSGAMAMRRGETPTKDTLRTAA